jgi:hypothetical protein
LSTTVQAATTTTTTTSSKTSTVVMSEVSNVFGSKQGSTFLYLIPHHQNQQGRGGAVSTAPAATYDEEEGVEEGIEYSSLFLGDAYPLSRQ